MKPLALPARLYFDYAASTPVAPEVLRVMRPYFGIRFGNPSSLHSFGQEAMAAVDRAREAVAAALDVSFREIIFTSGATEANNLALTGVVRHARCSVKNPKLIVSAVEHESVLETARAAEREGGEVVVVPVDGNGVVNVKKLTRELDERTVLVSVMYLNNEVGTVQPIAEISRIIQNFRDSQPSGPKTYPLFHTDAAQAFCYLACSPEALGVDLLTLSSQKIYGPKGAGALVINKNTEKGRVRSGSPPNSAFRVLNPIIHGGGQEFGLRSGTENVPALVGFGKAVELGSFLRAREGARIAALKNHFAREVKKIFPRVRVNGPDISPFNRPTNSRLVPFSPHIINLYFPGRPAQYILTRLDLSGVAASSGSACSARALEPSHVLRALGCDDERARQSVRFSFGRPTTKKDITALLKILKNILSSPR